MIHLLSVLSVVCVLSSDRASLARTETSDLAPPRVRLRANLEPIEVTAVFDGQLTTGPVAPYLDENWTPTVDGEPVTAAALRNLLLTPAPHVIAIEGSCFETTSVDVDISADEPTVVSIPMVERTVDVRLRLPPEFADARGLEVYAVQTFPISLDERRRRARLLGTVNDGDHIRLPVCAQGAIAVGDGITVYDLDPDGWDVGRAVVDRADVRRTDLPGDCFTAMVQSCKAVAVEDRYFAGADPDAATVDCEFQPQPYNGFGWVDTPDLNGDGMPELFLDWSDHGRGNVGTLHLSHDGVACGSYAGFMNRYGLRVGAARQDSLPDLYMDWAGGWTTVYEFDGKEYWKTGEVNCRAERFTDDEPRLVDREECRGAR